MRNINVIAIGAGALAVAIIGKEIVKAVSRRAHDQRMKDMPEGYYDLKKEELRIKEEKDKEERERKERLEMDARDREDVRRQETIEAENKRPDTYWLYKAAKEDNQARQYEAYKDCEARKYIASEGSWSDVQISRSDNDAKKHEYSELRKTVEAAFVNRYTFPYVVNELPKDMKKDLGLKE